MFQKSKYRQGLRLRLFLTFGFMAVVFNLFTAIVFLNAERSILELHQERAARAEIEKFLRSQTPEAVGGLTSHANAFAWRMADSEGPWSGETARAWTVKLPGERHIRHAYRWYGRSPSHMEIAGESPALADGARIVQWRAAVPLEDTSSVLDNTARLLAFYLLLNTLVLLGIGLIWLSRTVISPLGRLVGAIREVREPRDYHPIPVHRDDEIGILATAFNDFMTRIGKAEARNRAYVLQVEDAYRRLEEAQARVITSAKLASLGRLSAGIAHEVGNPLSAIIGYLRLLPEIEDPAEREQIVGRATKEALRIDHIIRGLLSLAHQPQEGEPPEPAAEFLEDLLATIAAQPSFHAIRIERNFEMLEKMLGDSPGDPPAETPPHAPSYAVDTAGGALKQVIVNLCVNAADAMGGEGCIHVTAAPQGNHLCITIEDEGPGIAEADLPYIFDPFFTTKPVGEGTGIGLSICHQIITAMHGSITVVPGTRGARFILELPMASSTVTES